PAPGVGGSLFVGSEPRPAFLLLAGGRTFRGHATCRSFAGGLPPLVLAPRRGPVGPSRNVGASGPTGRVAGLPRVSPRRDSHPREAGIRPPRHRRAPSRVLHGGARGGAAGRAA